MYSCTLAHTFFLPQRQCMAGVLLLLMMKSGSDSAALSRVDALQHSAAMLRKFSVSPHWEHGGFSSSVVHQCTLAPLLLYCFISGVFLTTFTLCSLLIHFDGTVASPVVFSVCVCVYILCFLGLSGSPASCCTLRCLLWIPVQPLKSTCALQV